MAVSSRRICFLVAPVQPDAVGDRRLTRSDGDPGRRASAGLALPPAIVGPDARPRRIGRQRAGGPLRPRAPARLSPRRPADRERRRELEERVGREAPGARRRTRAGRAARARRRRSARALCRRRQSHTLRPSAHSAQARSSVSSVDPSETTMICRVAGRVVEVEQVVDASGKTTAFVPRRDDDRDRRASASAMASLGGHERRAPQPPHSMQAAAGSPTYTYAMNATSSQKSRPLIGILTRQATALASGAASSLDRSSAPRGIAAVSVGAGAPSLKTCG